jgi:transcriptional regulator with XRE-family HTH domain
MKGLQLPMDNTLGGRIRQARKRANLSQSQLAAKIGAHVTSVSDWERGRNAPSSRHLLGIAKATGTQIERFNTDDDEGDDDRPAIDFLAAVRALVRAELAVAAEEGDTS